MLVLPQLVTTLKSIICSSRTTRETLDTVLFTNSSETRRKSVFHWSWLCQVLLILSRFLAKVTVRLVFEHIQAKYNVISKKRPEPKFDLNWNEPRSNHVSQTGPITQGNQQMNLSLINTQLFGYTSRINVQFFFR